MKRILLVAFTAAATWSGSTFGEMFGDDFVQSDRLFSPDFAGGGQVQGGGAVNAAYLEYVRSLLNSNYPVRSILLHAVGQGISISDAAYLLTLADPYRGGEFYATAVRMMKQMPGWVCGHHIDPELRYPVFYDSSRLGSAPRIHDVVSRFFSHGESVGFRRPGDPAWVFPDVRRKEYHFRASVDELIALKELEQRRTGVKRAWYEQGGRLPQPGEDGMPVLVSIHKFDKSVSVDADLDRLRRMRAAGLDRVPVVIRYNGTLELPITSECKSNPRDSAAEAGEPILTMEQVANNYFDCGVRLTPPRDWQQGDYHLLVRTAELQERFGGTGPGDIGVDRIRELEADIRANGYFPPLRVTLNRNSGLMWPGEREKVAVASDLGLQEIPVVFLFHEIARESCLALPMCGKAVCRAVVAGGAPFGEDECEKQLDNYADGFVLQSNQRKSIESGTATPGDEARQRQTIELLNRAAQQLR